MFGWFKKKLPWQDEYAYNLYNGLVADDHLGEMTPAKLRVPIASYARYHEKALLNRELMCFTALMGSAHSTTELPPVMMAFGRLLVAKLAARGVQISLDDLAEAAPIEVERMMKEPFAWAQGWLAEFRDDPNDNFMVALFADHSLKQFQAFKHAIEKTRRR
jgi:hypothetical protein